ncbi:MAG TPA: TIGR03067 domain-containing protein [Candidatus Acidoferrum sp.]|jgi:uncharacterized protein (TIGR03067 family)|nr:TIGR03067 domain-containing protein [Candidatus Acidoferrum sp.]
MTDLDKLQGTWNVTALEMDGHEVAVPGSACIVIAGDRFQSLGMGAVYEGTVELNTRKKPKHFDLLFTEGPEAGNRSLGIYELKGDDWKLCLTVTGSTRPTKFATSPGSGHAFETLRRGGDAAVQKTTDDEAAAPLPSSASDPAPELEGEWKMVACRADGHAVPESIVNTGKRIARGGQSTTYFGAKVLMRARYKVDKSVAPHTVDYTIGNGKQPLGIWRFEGDTLEICFAPPGKPRPADFTAPGGTGHTFTAWKRIG